MPLDARRWLVKPVRWQRGRYIRENDPICPVGRIFWLATRRIPRPGAIAATLRTPPVDPCSIHDGPCPRWRTAFSFAPAIATGYYGAVHPDAVELDDVFIDAPPFAMGFWAYLVRCAEVPLRRN